jgi:hypothetical protein
LEPVVPVAVGQHGVDGKLLRQYEKQSLSTFCLSLSLTLSFSLFADAQHKGKRVEKEMKFIF